MLQTHIEDDVNKHLENGYCTREVWDDYWWSQRAHALRLIIDLQKSIEFHQGYVERCTERLNRPDPKQIVEPPAE